MEGITVEILGEALRQARSARAHILGEMKRCNPAPRGALADNAPRIRIVIVDPDKIGILIGPGGRTIRALEAESGAEQIQVRTTILSPSVMSVIIRKLCLGQCATHQDCKHRPRQGRNPDRARGARHLGLQGGVWG